jgi:hypothetical protein
MLSWVFLLIYLAIVNLVPILNNFNLYGSYREMKTSCDKSVLCVLNGFSSTPGRMIITLCCRG